MDCKHSETYSKELLETLIVTKKRIETPVQCVGLLAKNLKLEQSSAENLIVLPKTDARKFACKYPTKETLQTTFNLPKARVSCQELPSLMKKLKEDQENLLKVLEVCTQGDMIQVT